MLDHDRILAAAIGTTVRSGIERNAADFLPKVKANFDFHLQQFQQHARAQSPDFFKPPAPAVRAEPMPASIVSAPVSQDVPSADRQLSVPGKVTLTAEEKDAARFSGISEADYARNKIKLLGAKARGGNNMKTDTAKSVPRCRLRGGTFAPFSTLRR